MGLISFNFFIFHILLVQLYCYLVDGKLNQDIINQDIERHELAFALVARKMRKINFLPEKIT